MSIASLLQNQLAAGSQVAEIMVVTHRTEEGQLRGVIQQLKGLSCVASVQSVIRVEDGRGA